VGGDEFGALLVDCDDADLRTIAQRLRDALPHAGGCSIGIARFSPTDDANALMLRADAALYSDKAAGARSAPLVA
jgi:GGDEF domain-containing protein